MLSLGDMGRSNSCARVSATRRVAGLGSV